MMYEPTLQALKDEIAELKKELQVLKDERFVFPQRLSEREKRTLNNIMFKFGHVVFPAGDEVVIPMSVPTSAVVVTSGGYTAYIRNGTISSQNELYIVGTENEETNYIVFLTTEVSTNV